MKTKIFLVLLVWLSISIPAPASAEYGMYYGMDPAYAKRIAATFDMMIIQPYNYDLYMNYPGKKICYLTIGEFDGTAAELAKL